MLISYDDQVGDKYKKYTSETTNKNFRMERNFSDVIKCCKKFLLPKEFQKLSLNKFLEHRTDKNIMVMDYTWAEFDSLRQNVRFISQ